MTQTQCDLLLIGDVVLPDRVIRNGHVAISGETILSVGEAERPLAKRTEDYSGCLLFPGLIDAQVHAGSHEGVKGLEDATKAAAAGGVTTIIDMPFDDPDPVNNVDLFKQKVDIANRISTVDVGLYITARKDGNYKVLRDLVREGAVSIKLSTYEYHPVRFPRFSTGEMYEIFLEAAELGIPVAFHNEDQELVSHLIARAAAAGKKGMEIHGAGRAPLAELVADAQILELAASTNVRCHIVHSTIAAGNRIARHYRERGAKISVETCVHYFIFNDQDAIRQGAFLKLNPPIRAEHERLEMWKSLAAGEIDLVSTDHVAWPISRKSDPDMAKNGSGVPGLETLLPAFYTGAVRDHGHAPGLVAALTAENPARHFGLYPRKGRLTAGADADVAVFCPQARRFEAKSMTSWVKWSPFDGMDMAGYVRATYVRGRKVFENSQLQADPGVGRFVRPN
ncbi:MAG: amidohydrolase family protein [Pseudorhodoplanes sp.]|nr:amidohydrolase family protein [Pseudorhodoplanes sp.]MCL4711155.1 amidohydrolase family protein [Pseudorhodoplanes sp.]